MDFIDYSIGISLLVMAFCVSLYTISVVIHIWRG